MRPTIENAKKLEEAQNFRVGPTIENAKRQQEYSDSLQQQYGALEPYEESLREKAVGALQNLGLSRHTAQGFLGNTSADTILDSMGLIDFTPFALPFVFNEAKRGFDKAEKPTDYIAPTLEAGLGLIEAYPLTKPLVTPVTRPLRQFLRNLSSKTTTPVDKGRRTVVGGMVSAPIAGALSNIPIGKSVYDVVPVVKKASPIMKKLGNIESMFKLTDLPQMRKAIIKSNPDVLKEVDYSKEFGKKVNSVDDLTSDEVDKVFTDFFSTSGYENYAAENMLRQDIKEVLDNLMLPPEEFVSGTEKLKPSDVKDFTAGEILEDFTAEMKKSGYKTDEISTVINNSFDDLFSEATSLDDVLSSSKNNVKTKSINTTALKKSKDVTSILKLSNIPKITKTIKEADINELNNIISKEHDKYGGLYEKSKLPEGMDYMKFKKMLINLSERFDFKNTNLKKPRKFDSLTDINKQKIYDMSLDKSVDQDQLQDIVDELRDEEKFWGAR